MNATMSRIIYPTSSIFGWKHDSLILFVLIHFCCFLALMKPMSSFFFHRTTSIVSPSYLHRPREWKTEPTTSHNNALLRSLLLNRHHHTRTATCTASFSREEGGDETSLLVDEQWKERAKRWVILVDDEESIRHAVGDFLFDQGYQVTACSDADAMFQVIFRKTGVPDRNSTTDTHDDSGVPAIPDIIISDVRMPGKSGIQLTEIIRGNERLRRVPIILLTAKSLTQDRVAGYKAGADVYLPKPFSPDELLSIIDGVILRRQQMAGERGKMADLADELSNVKQLLQQETGRYNNIATISSRRQIRLTPKEQEVLEILSKGYTNSEIAAERGVSIVGVNRTIQTLYRKTRTSTRTELIRWGIQSGQLPKP